MGAEVNDVRDEVGTLWEAALSAWDRGSSTEQYEAAFSELLDLALSHPTALAEVESRALYSLPHLPSGAADLISYLMHTLRLNVVRSEAARLLAAASAPDVGDEFARILDSFHGGWEDRDLYERYSGRGRGR